MSNFTFVCHGCWDEVETFDSKLTWLLGMFHLSPFLWLLVSSLCLVSYAFCLASAVVRARFFRVREHVMLPFHYSRIITPHSIVPVSTRARGVNKLVHHGCACVYSSSIEKSILLNMVSGPVFTANQLLVDTTAPLNSFFGNISNLHQHFTIRYAEARKVYPRCTSRATKPWP